MGDSFDAKGGIIAGILLGIGVLFCSGVIGPESEVLSKIIHFLGIASIVVCVLIVLLIVALFFVARKSIEVDENQSDKAKIKQTINDNRQQLSKLKSQATLLNMKLGNVNAKIKELDNRIKLCEDNAKRYLNQGDEASAKAELEKKNSILSNREGLLASYNEYNNSLNDLNDMIDKLEGNIVSIENRRDDALTKLNIASTKKMIGEYEGKGNYEQLDALNNLENKAQYEDDYANALKELNGGQH